MFKTMIISTEDGTFKLSALLYGDKYKMPFLELLNNDEPRVWDNIDYLVGELFTYLSSDVKSDELDEILLSHKDELLEIFIEGFTLGFFEDWKSNVGD